MKYTVSNTINRPFDEVIAKFKEPGSGVKWMEGLEKMDLISGAHGEVGAKSQLHFIHKGKEMQMTETILENRPDGMKFAFDGPMGSNEVDIRFEKLSDDSVKQVNTSEFKLSGFMKIMGVLFKGMFKKQSMKYMVQFKEYVEQ